MTIPDKARLLAASLAACLLTTPAQSTEFFGTATATANVSPNAGCTPLPFQGIASGTGTSGFGAFTYNHTACTSGATGPVIGTFLIDFGVDRFSGSFQGSSTATSTIGVFDLLFNYTIDSGTGRFSDGTGMFRNVGSVDVRGGPPSRLTLNFSAVPEPGTWMMMLVGFGAIGAAIRRRRSAADPIPQIA